MSYSNVISLIFIIIGALVTIVTLPYVITYVVGVFAKAKTFPVAKEKLRYGVVICARNEERVVGHLIESIRKCDYPQDKLDIFVIAHNCTDKTAEVALKTCGGGDFGVHVLEYSNPQERTKGYALKRIFEYIDENFGIKNYDGFHVFDADNVLDSQYFNKMNDAFLFYDKKNVIMGFRNSKNFGANVQTAMYGILYVSESVIEARGKEVLRYSSRLNGSGFLLASHMVENGWDIVNLSDDIDFTIEQILQGYDVKYCDAAMYYDEHPTTFKAMWRQRLRWAKGTLIVFKKRFSSLVHNIFGRKEKFKEKRLVSAHTMLCWIAPFGAIGVVLSLTNLVLLCLSPLFGENFGHILLMFLIFHLVSVSLGYLASMLIAVICYIKEKRIPKISLRVKILSVLLWPLFIFLGLVLQIVAMFTRQFTWTQIVHSDSGGHETFNDVSLETAKSEIKNTEGEE